MRRAMVVGMIVLMGVVTGSPAASARSTNSRAVARGELLYLGSGQSVTAVSPTTGAVRYSETAAVPTRDWSRVYTTESYEGTHTLLHALDARTGRVISTQKLKGSLYVRAVSDDGAAVALMSPFSGSDTYHPQPRAETNLVIARRGHARPTRLTVPANVEPEAFSLSRRSLFVIEFTPPEAPTRYRVARVDLATGQVAAVPSNEDELQEPMRGTARAQAMAPDGRRLYTLYTRDATSDAPAEAFVHVLDLEHERANCIDLPPEFAASPLGALAVAPSGARLYVYASTVPAIAEIDTVALELTRTVRLPDTARGTAVPRETVVNPTALYVAAGNRVTTVDLASLSVTRQWTVAGIVTGIEASGDAADLYVSLLDRVLVVDPINGSERRQFFVRSSGAIDHVAPALRPLVQGYSEPVQCAC
jgi:DNA-binding beta-propeller fold protein YncE